MAKTDAIEVVVFDWDGTLVDSELHIVKSMQKASDEMNLPRLPHDKIKDIIGLGMYEAILALYPNLREQQVESFRAAYGRHFFSAGTVPSDLFARVRETLDFLKSANFNIAVATGKSRNGLEKALDSTGLRSYFDITKCADETRSKPHPKMLEEIVQYFGSRPSSMVMVGDTEYDLAMAGKIGMPSIGVSYGVHDVSRLEQHEPLGVVDCISEIVDLI